MNSLKKALLGLLITLIISIIFIGAWSYNTLQNSLPKLDGQQIIQSLSHQVIIERDASGIATIKGQNRSDIATATGFIHAQERFFQMDLLRRNSAGELSSLFGSIALNVDKAVRVHRFRDRAKKIIAQLPQDQLNLLQAYTRGVNNGLASLESKPFEYFLLQQTPKKWQEEDSILTIFSMYLDLQYPDGKRERSLGLMKSVLAGNVYDFLNPKGSVWDAAIDNTQFNPSLMPETPWPAAGSAALTSNAIKPIINDHVVVSAIQKKSYQSDAFPGSNNWAVSGEISATGSAIVANDMHLGIRTPNIWFRASFEYPAKLIKTPTQDKQKFIKVTGATLPGTPNIVVGSNGHIAWGFTNSYGDFSDIVLLKINDSGSQYLTPNGYKDFDLIEQIVEIKDKPAITIEVKETIWGPVIGKNYQGQLMAYRWTAHDIGAVNLNATKLESALNIDQAMHIANMSGIPSQNMMVGDKSGNIGWTIMGLIPNKFGGVGETPSFWHDSNKGWQGYLSPDMYPKVKNPQDNRLWTANSRVVGGEMFEQLGNGGYALGARSQQIRDALYQKEHFNEQDLLAIALDDKATFLQRWNDFLVTKVVTISAIEKHPQFEQVKNILANQQPLRASINSVRYLLVRNFRMNVRNSVFSELNRVLEKSDNKFSFRSIRNQLETPLWEMVNQQKQNFLMLPESSWSTLFNKALIKTLDDMTNKGGANEIALDDATWGQYNTTAIKHPLSKAVPFIGRWLDMPATPLSGDSYMPKVQGKAFGASERMVVSPGHEESGIFHMPTSQSGHPLSPFYGVGHRDWEEGNASPFLPQKTVYTLSLENGKP